MKIPLEHEELTGRIRQAVFETHCYFGNEFLEKIYENSLSRHLRKIGLGALQQEPITVRDEAQVHHYLKISKLTDLLSNSSLTSGPKSSNSKW